MPDLVIWTGPVNLMQVPGATVPGAIERALPCTGDGSSPPKCSDMAEALRYAGQGSMLRGMAGRAGTSLEEVDDVFVGAFSAGGTVVKRMVANRDDRRRITAVMLSDATYSGAWADIKIRRPVVQPEWVDFGCEVAQGTGKLWVATASPSPNYTWATGVECLREIRRQIEERLGQRFERLDHFYGVYPPPEYAYKLGNVIFAEYPMKPLGHGHTKIADQVWQKVLWPWLERRGGVGPVPPPPEPPGPPQPPVEPEQPRVLADTTKELAYQMASLGFGALVGYLLVNLFKPQV